MNESGPQTTSQLVVLMILLAAVLIAGCGNSGTNDADRDSPIDQGGRSADSGAATTGESEKGRLDERKFVEVANRICARSMQRMERKYQPFFNDKRKVTAPNAWASDVISKFVAPGMRTQVRELKRLHLRPDQADQVDALATAIDSVLEDARADPLSFINRANPFSESLRVADKYGLPACGRL